MVRRAAGARRRALPGLGARRAHRLGGPARRPRGRHPHPRPRRRGPIRPDRGRRGGRRSLRLLARRRRSAAGSGLSLPARRRARLVADRRSVARSRGPTRRGAAARPAISFSTNCTSAPSRRRARSPARRSCLERLRDLGVTAIELMPVADFRRPRNWGYDGVALFAPARCYGTPDDLRRLIDRAHHFGLAVLLDVVYNHLGPEGAYLPGFSPDVPHRPATGRRGGMPSTSTARKRGGARASSSRTPCTGFASIMSTASVSTPRTPSSTTGPAHFVRRASSRRCATPRRVAGSWCIAEDHRNLARMIDGRDADGWGLDARLGRRLPPRQMRRLLAGDSTATTRTSPDTSATSRRPSGRGGSTPASPRGTSAEPRGTDPSASAHARGSSSACRTTIRSATARSAIACNHRSTPAAWRAASAVLLYGADDAAALHGPGVGGEHPVPATSPTTSRARASS